MRRPDAYWPLRGPDGKAISQPYFLGEEHPAGTPGAATGNGNNCLIHSLAQAVSGEFDSPAGRPGQDAFCAAIRDELVAKYRCPCVDLLDFAYWCERIVLAFGLPPSGYTATCFSREHPSGAKVGRGPAKIQVVNLGNAHFVPLIPNQTGSLSGAHAPSEERPPAPSSPYEVGEEWLGSPVAPSGGDPHESPNAQETRQEQASSCSPPAEKAEGGVEEEANEARPRIPRQRADSAEEDRRSPATLLSLVRKLGDDEDAPIKWAVGNKILHLPPKCKFGHNWAIRKKSRPSRSKKDKVGVEGGFASNYRLKCTHGQPRQKEKNRKKAAN